MHPYTHDSLSLPPPPILSLSPCLPVSPRLFMFTFTALTSPSHRPTPHPSYSLTPTPGSCGPCTPQTPSTGCPSRPSRPSSACASSRRAATRGSRTRSGRGAPSSRWMRRARTCAAGRRCSRRRASLSAVCMRCVACGALHVHHGESQTHHGRHVLMMGDVYFAERLWRGGAGAAAEAGGVLRQVRQDERGAHAPRGGLEGVQGASRVRLAFGVSAEVCADTTRRDAAQGSVFVEFADFKSVEAFLNADPKPAWDGKELLIMSK